MKKAIGIIATLMLVASFFKGGIDSPQHEYVTNDIKSTDIDNLEVTETVHILTDEELSRLYSYKQDIRIKDDSIVELDQSDAELLMKISRAEAGTSFDGQLWVMRVILNRLEDGNFGDSIYEIISADNQFEVFSNGNYKDAEINANTHLALALIEGGWDETNDALYFESSSNSDESWHKQNREFVKEVEGQIFYK